MSAASTHQVALATLEALTLLRESYIGLHGMYVAHYRPVAQDLARADRYGDLRRDLAFEQVSGFQLVVDVPAMFRRVHHVTYGTDEWGTYPIIGECSLNAQVSEGDVIGLYNRYLSADSSIEYAREFKYLQVTNVRTGIHYRPISKLLSLATYRDQSLNQLQSPAFIDILNDGVGCWVQPSSQYAGAADGVPVTPVPDATGAGYELTYPLAAPTLSTVDSLYRILECDSAHPLFIDLTHGGNNQPYAQATIIEVLPAGIVVTTTTNLASYTSSQPMYGALLINRYLTQAELDEIVAVFSDYSPPSLILSDSTAIILSDNVSTLLP